MDWSNRPGLPLPLSALVCLGLVLKIRLPLAIASNGSFIYSILLLYGGYTATHSARCPRFELSDLWGPVTFLLLPLWSPR